MFGAVAAGKDRGGYDTITDAAKEMGRVKDEYYQPKLKNAAVYNVLYSEYARLYDYFGRGENNVMKTLKKLKNASSSEKKEETVC
jgi:L-ribulokinase